MANLCIIDFKVRGKKENIQSFVDAMEQKNGVYMGRGAEITYDYEEEKDGICTLNGCGSTKWSIASSLISNAYHMRNDPKGWGYRDRFEKLEILSLNEACEKYDVEFEGFGAESGFCFIEHHYCGKGEYYENVYNYNEYSIYDLVDEGNTLEDINKLLGKSKKSLDDYGDWEVVTDCPYYNDDESFNFVYIN